ncbi:MAG: TlpA disulfide reductase family protein [Chloroflexota bacterium]
MNEQNGKQLIARTLKEYAVQEIPDNPNPWPDLRTRATLPISLTAQHLMLEKKSEPAGVRLAPKGLSTSGQRINFAAVMIVLVIAAVAIFATVYYGGRPLPAPESVAQAPTSSGAIGENGLPGAFPAPTKTAELIDAEQMIGRLAPDASLIDVRTGQTTKISSFSGKAVLLTIWFTRCSPCLSTVANMQQVYDQYKEKVDFISISFGPTENAARVKAFVDQNSYAWTFLHVTDVGLIPYPVQAAPTTYFIGSDDIIHAAFVGEMDVDMLTSKLELDLNNSSDPTKVP